MQHYMTESAMSEAPRRKERRGFASMSPEKQREIASKGGRAAHRKGTAHRWSSEEARVAGVGVGDDLVHRGVAGKGRDRVGGDLLEIGRSRVTRRVAQDDEHGGGLLPEPIRQQLLGGPGFGTRDLPPALGQLAPRLVGPDRQTDDEGQPDGWDPASKAVREPAEGRKHGRHSSRPDRFTPEAGRWGPSRGYDRARMSQRHAA